MLFKPNESVLLHFLFAFISLSISTVSAQGSQQWLTYNSPDFRYSIQYPPDWESLEEHNIGGQQNTSSKMFDLPEKYFLGALVVSIEPVEKYLDADSLTLKTRTLNDYVRNQIRAVNSSPDLQFNKNISTTIGQNHYPAQQVHFVGGIPGLQEEYRINTYMVDRGYLYTFSFFTSPLDIPELLPIVERMLASFQIASQQ
jgi:hypothetical protein